MTNFNVTTKVLLIDSSDTRADSVTGSTANSITAYLETVADTKTIRSITSTPVSNSQTSFIIIHDT